MKTSQNLANSERLRGQQIIDISASGNAPKTDFRQDDRIERIETVQAGLGSGDWEVYVQLLEPPFEGEEVSIYLVSCDYDRVGHFSNGCVDRRLLELFSRASKQEPE
jgi:hypothetical protein